MIELGNSFKGQYTLVMSNGERLHLESHIVNDYFAGLKTDTEHINLIKKAVNVYPDNS